MFKQPSKEVLSNKLNECAYRLNKLELKLEHLTSKKDSLTEKRFNDKRENIEYEISKENGVYDMIYDMFNDLFDFKSVGKTYELLTKGFMQADKYHCKYSELNNSEEAEKYLNASCYIRGKRSVLSEFGYDYKEGR